MLVWQGGGDDLEFGWVQLLFLGTISQKHTMVNLIILYLQNKLIEELADSMLSMMRPAVISCLASAGIVQKPQDVTSGLASSKLRTLSATGHTKCISAIPCMFRSIRTLSWMR